jgi:hypothetical protein
LDEVLSLLASLLEESDPRRRREELAKLRREWTVYFLALETVVYRALDGVESESRPRSRADERLIEHELIEVFFDKLGRCCGLEEEWAECVAIVEEAIQRHVRTVRRELFARLERECDAQRLRELGEQYVLASEKLAVLEEAKSRVG